MHTAGNASFAFFVAASLTDFKDVAAIILVVVMMVSLRSQTRNAGYR
ncbi:hypothetical protein Pint_33146 [Pistacia integerrima]|uniref:Uncharacterized protein n=1 Tax=Pistacia integerrima TaxID=434235 RepID=A0ACC0X468_9ROSI|nr:hypothetical protein Pint_33146 [Pistacia integerrima]